MTVNRCPASDIEISRKKYIDNELDKKNVLRFNQTLENYLKVCVGNDVYKLTKYDTLQIADTTTIFYPNTGTDLLQNWVVKCNDKNISSEIQSFIKSSRTTTPNPNTGSNNLPLIGNV